MLHFQARPRTLLVDNGRVMCPLKGDIDIEQCFGCPWLRSLELDRSPAQVTCQAETSGQCPAARVPLQYEDTGY